MKQKIKQLQSSGETRKTNRTWHFLSTLNSLLLSKLLLLLIIPAMGTANAWGDTTKTFTASESNAKSAYYLAPDGTAVTAIAGSGHSNIGWDNAAKITVQSAATSYKVATLAFTIKDGVTVTGFTVNGTASNDVDYALDGTAVTFGTELTGLSKTGTMSFTLTCKDETGSSNRNTKITSIVLTYTTGGGGSVAVTSVSLDQTAKTIGVGDNFTLTPTISPANATNKSVSWSSSAPGKASVSDGTVTGVAAGSATITVTTVDGSKTATCDVTVKAKHHVTYNLGGGTGTLPTQADVMETGTFSVASGSGLSKDGYTFAGWSDESETYTAGAPYTMGTEDVTLTAQWIENVETYTVTFNGNGHGTPGETSLEGASVTLPDCEPEASYYQFMGWSTSSTATTATLSAGASYAPTKDITLYAVYNYQVNVETTAGGTVTAKYDHSGGEDFFPGTKVPLNTVLYFNASPSSSDYVFTGWGTATTSKDNPLTYTIKDIKTFTATFTQKAGVGDYVWFAWSGDATTNGTTQSNAFTGVQTASSNSHAVSGSYTIGGKNYVISARGSNGSINISFTVPTNKVATLYGLATSSGTSARPLTLTGSGAATGYVNTTQNTSASTTVAGQFTYTSLLPGTYNLTANGGCSVEFLYLDLETAGAPTITTQPVSATYNYGASATPLTVAATAAQGGTLHYQWMKSNTESGEYTNVGLDSPSFTPSTSEYVGTKYYKVVVSEDGGESTTSAVVSITVNTNASDLEVSSNVVSAKVGAGSKTVTYTTSSPEAVTAVSSATGVATVLIDGNTITISPVAAGTATITVSQEATTGYAAGSATINVTVAASGGTTSELLFFRDFTESEWSNAKFEQHNTSTPDVNYDVTTYGKSDDNSKNFSWNNGLKLPDSNLESSNYYLAIPVSNVNKGLTINVVGTANKLGYVCKTGSIGNPGGTGTEVTGTQDGSVYKFTITPSSISTGNYVIYIGGKSNVNNILKSITITTPTPNGLAAPSITSVEAAPVSIGTGETSTVTCTSERGYHYEWYVGKTNDINDATEVYGETLSKFDFKPTEKGTYYIFCKAINSVGVATSSSATVNVVETPTLSFNIASTRYNDNTNRWSEDIVPVLTVTPSNLLSSVTYSVTQNGDPTSNLGYTGDANGVGSLTKHDVSGTYKVTATLTTSGVSEVKDGTYTADLIVKVTAGYDDALGADYTPAVGATRNVYDDDGNVMATMTFGGWTHGKADGTVKKWNKRADDGTTYQPCDDSIDGWATTSNGDQGHVSIDDYDYESFAQSDSRSETKWVVEWEEGKVGVKAKPYSMPCRGAYVTVTPVKNGTLTIYLYQNGSFKNKSTTEVAAAGPRVYTWFDQNGNVIPVIASVCNAKVSNSEKLSNMKTNIINTWGASTPYGITSLDTPNNDLAQAIHDYWVDNTTSAQRPIPYKGGNFLPTKNFVKYTVKMLAGITYYFFSNSSKIGYAGLNYAPAPNGTVEIEIPGGGNETVYTLESFALTSNNTSYAAPTTTTTYKTVTLDRTFKQNTWNTICLPFAVSKQQVESVFGKGTVFMGYDGFSNGTLSFIYHAYDYLLPGQPYFIKPTGKDANGYDLPTVEGGYIGAADSKNLITFNNVTIVANQTSSDVDGKKDIFEFKGSFRNQSMTPYSYYLSGSGTLSYSKTKTYGLAGYRAFLYNETQSANSLVLNFEYKDFSDDEDVPTAIDDIMEYIAEQGITVQTRHGVYTLSGQKISDTPENLAPGLYIINGKKIYIK